MEVITWEDFHNINAKDRITIWIKFEKKIKIRKLSIDNDNIKFE